MEVHAQIAKQIAIISATVLVPGLGFQAYYPLPGRAIVLLLKVYLLNLILPLFALIDLFIEI